MKVKQLPSLNRASFKKTIKNSFAAVVNCRRFCREHFFQLLLMSDMMAFGVTKYAILRLKGTTKAQRFVSCNRKLD